MCIMCCTFVFIPHLQGIIPATWMVEDHGWEYLSDRMGHAIVTMVAHGLKTKDRFDTTLTLAMYNKIGFWLVVVACLEGLLAHREG